MAGSRERSGRPRRKVAREKRMRERLAGAGTAGEQLAIAFDWWRIEAKDNEPLQRDLAERLANEALQLERGRL